MRKRIVILGAGESGVGAAVLAQKEGYEVFVSDSASIRPESKKILADHAILYEEKGHTKEMILHCDETVTSPGIPAHAPIIREIIKKNIPVISEIEFASRYTTSKLICITGSNGKTTTTMLTWHIFIAAGLDVGLAGNVGHSFAMQVAESPHDYYIIELSSFQLDNMFDFKADIAILLNITPDHLDRYHYNFQEYVDSKFRITRNQTRDDAFIYWNDDPVIRAGIERFKPKAIAYPFSEKYMPGVKGYVRDGKIILETSKGIYTMDRDLLSLKGTHNLYNSLASGIAAKVTEIRDEKIRASLTDFCGVEHRLEMVARVRGVDYINDSKATNVNACWFALQSIQTPVVLILGGTDKGNDYTEIAHLVRKRVHALIFLGLDNRKLHDFFDGLVSQTEDACSMEEAVAKAYRLAKKGDTVLLSPCCASFDLFQNFEDRGDQFKEYVRNL